MKEVRKNITMLAALGVVMAGAVPGHAFTSIDAKTLTASVLVGGNPTVAITSALIKNVSNNATVTNIAWTGVDAGTGWKVADQYIELKTNINTTNGGVQIYTDNTNAAANPRFTGPVDSNNATPAGLVDNAVTSQKIPTAWRASASTGTVAAANPNGGAGESFLWFFHEDKAQVAVPSQNASAFVNGDPFVTVYAAPGMTLTGQPSPVPGGVHFAQDPQSFGGFATSGTTSIYTEADFTTALVGKTYSTNRLILEAFSL